MNPIGTLVFFTGKMGAGKSTLAGKQAKELGAVLLSEDEWLAALYPNEIRDMNDYIKYSERLKPLLAAHVQNILNSGISVVLDFPGNTIAQRAWFMNLIANGENPHKLIFLKASNEICLSRLERRRIQQPDRTAFDTEDMFHRVTKYFDPPSSNEAFRIEVIDQDDACPGSVANGQTSKGI